MSDITEVIWGSEALDPFYVEQIKTLRSKVIHSIEASGEKIIGITSTTSGEGKTSVSANLARAIAAIGDKKVILIDGDLRKCDMTVAHKLYGKPGMTNFLEEKEKRIDAILKNSKWSNLYIIPSGRKTQHSSELLTKSIFKNLLKFLSDQFDLIVIDLPPIISTSDPVAVKEVIDKFVMVYLAGKTPQKLLEFAINEIGKDKILGMVLNGIDTDKIIKYRKYHYYYY
jgi:capsular exopolysaccharide synthesis family protein